ncbi:MAG: Asp-tRNA(Asn)/Glu-tRNA(Gln) amidotransferase subunit GatC [Proteobacteria bacterium]|nr:Asp-tRNA(Asn)/Glu-tRNA(Gln) amidotransferase subunit GatC [Pseudomonadota bacterium]
MSLSHDEIQRLARLARIEVTAEESVAVETRLNRVLGLIDEMRAVDTGAALPMAHALELVQRLRPDAVTESDLHARYQSVAPAVDGDLYLVPKVIE